MKSAAFFRDLFKSEEEIFQQARTATKRHAQDLAALSQSQLQLGSAAVSAMKKVISDARRYELDLIRESGAHLALYKRRLEIERNINDLTQRIQDVQNERAAIPVFSPTRRQAIDQHDKIIKDLVDDTSRAYAEKRKLDEIASENLRQQGLIWKGTKLAMLAFTESALRAAQELKASGMTYGQTFKNWFGSIADTFRALKTGEIMSPYDSARARASFAQNQMFAGIPKGLLEGISVTSTAGGDAGAAAQLSYRVFQVKGWSEHAANSWLKITNQIATTAKVPIDQLLKKSAEYGDLLANAANRSASAFSTAVIRSERMGVSLRSVESVADNMTGSFENYLEAQAKLQTVMPGTDLTGVLLASQYGSDADILKSLQSAIGGRDIGKMPRSIRNLVAQSFGLSVNEISNLGKGESPELKIQKDSLDRLTGIKTAMDKLLGIGGALFGIAGIGLMTSTLLQWIVKLKGIELFTGGLRGMLPWGSSSGIMGMATRGALGGGFAGRLANMFGAGGATLGGIGKLGRMGAGLGIGAGFELASLGLDAYGHHGLAGAAQIGSFTSAGAGIGTLFGPGPGTLIGGLIGAGVGTALNWNKMFGQHTEQTSTDLEEHADRVTETDTTNTDRIVQKLDDLEKALYRIQVVVNMDGYRTGQAVTRAHGRSVNRIPG